LKKIKFISFARTGKFYPKRPNGKTCQILLDFSLLRETLPDGAGPEKNIDALVLKENDDFFSSQKYALRTQINYFLQKDFNIFKIFFVCQDGLAGSRVAADYFKAWVSLNYPNSLSVSVTHAELYLMDKARKKSRCLRKISNFFHLKNALGKSESIIFCKKILTFLKSFSFAKADS
jgi:hypothetical protein